MRKRRVRTKNDDPCPTRLRDPMWIRKGCDLKCMGDAQFDMHGGTALRWMTLEGTKSAGTDLHSKMAKTPACNATELKCLTIR